MIKGIGTDLLEKKRVEKSISKFGDKFIKKVLTEKEQREIANILLSINNLILINKKKLKKYKSLKKSLMQDLLTGKVRVSVN